MTNLPKLHDGDRVTVTIHGVVIDPDQLEHVNTP